MTRSKIRENVFKMLFRVEFHDKSELAAVSYTHLTLPTT